MEGFLGRTWDISLGWSSASGCVLLIDPTLSPSRSWRIKG